MTVQCVGMTTCNWEEEGLMSHSNQGERLECRNASVVESVEIRVDLDRNSKR